MLKLFIRIALVAAVLAAGGYVAMKLKAMKQPPVEEKARELPLAVEGVRAEYGDHVVTVSGLRRFIERNFIEVFGNYDKLKQGAHYTVALATMPD